MSKKKQLWEYKTEQRPGEVAFYWAEAHLAQKALEEGLTDFEYSNGGTFRTEFLLDDFMNELKAMGMRLFYHKVSSYMGRDDLYFLLGEDTACWIDYTKKLSSISIIAHTLVEANVEKFRELSRKYITRLVTKGAIYALVSTSSGPQLRQFGMGGEDFIESNYRPEVSAEYQHVVDDLNSNDPCGRIVILDGPPGTGKTHMVRALLNEVPKAKFILVPSNMITSLGSPDFLSVLMQQQRQGYPMVLILEDADEALSSRKADNVSAISSLLNFSDGIFGSLMDMRIIATTNVDLGDLDKAVMRDGRLCRRIEVGLLEHEQAEAIYARISEKPSGGLFTAGNFYPLGTVYKLAKGGGNAKDIVPKKPKGLIGFQAEVPIEAVFERDPKTQKLKCVGVVDEQGEVQEPNKALLDIQDLVRRIEIENDDDLIDEDPPEEGSPQPSEFYPEEEDDSEDD